MAGFSDPNVDPSKTEMKVWMPDYENPPKDLDLFQARFILTHVGDQFCDLYQQENAAYEEYTIRKVAEKEDDDDDCEPIAWKRVVNGVREMCDVCETTLFNYHYACKKCGVVVCIDCYKARQNDEKKLWNDGQEESDRDDFYWFKCGNRNHEPDNLILSQIVAGDALQILARQLHEVRAKWGIPQNCGCKLSEIPATPEELELCQKLMQTQTGNASENDTKDTKIQIKSCIERHVLASNGNDSEDSSDDEGTADFQNFLTRTDPELKKAITESEVKPNVNALNAQINAAPLTDVQPVANGYAPAEEPILTASDGRRNRRYLPLRIMTLSASLKMYPNVPHMWLCEGKLLRLLDPLNTGNTDLFQEQWKRGQPVIVSEVSSCLDKNLWRPEAFSKEFGEDPNDLVNCMTGTLVPNQPMKRFWDGFDYIQKRIKDKNGDQMLLKLKDWPPGEDFAEILPTRFNDLMRCLPLGDYTKRDGKFNLASRLPNIFVKPDLGPKMYNAYGSALHPTKGTTNLHLDISDAVNVMVYVGIPKDTGTDDAHIIEAYTAIDEAGCDILTRRRVREGKELPGALWHIYAPRDANKIRDLLNKITIERGERLEPNHDPIHDQSWYLDGELRERLYNEYGVEGYPIAQCLGDAVFIPAGAPHQVRNLHNCIKVAEDFVSPENVSECFHLTHEFRALSDTHANHEDKLQIKNIIYHAVKDAVAKLSHIFNENTIKPKTPSVDIKLEPASNEETN